MDKTSNKNTTAEPVTPLNERSTITPSFKTNIKASLKPSIKPWESLTLADDFIFCKVMTNEEVCKTLLEHMLDIKIARLEYVESQRTIDLSLDAKGVRLDVYVADSDRVFDIEMQKIAKTDLPLRARYYQSMIDIDTIHKGEPYTALKESYVIFICLTDPFGDDLSCYHFENICQENKSRKLDDMAHKVFYNASRHDKEKNPEIKAFLEFLTQGKVETPLTARLKDLVDETLHDEKWRLNYMTLEMIRQEEKADGIQIGKELGREEGREEGRQEGLFQTAKNLKDMGLDSKQISKATGLSIEEIEKL